MTNTGSKTFWRFSIKRLTAVLSVCLLLTGCSTAFQARFKNPAYSFNQPAPEITFNGTGISKRTQQTLRTYDLEKTAKKKPPAALEELLKETNREPTLDLVFAVAELANIQAKRNEPAYWYYQSAKYAFGYLFDPRFNNRRNRYDPHFRKACLFYNEGTEQILRHFSEKNTVNLSPERTLYLTEELKGHPLCNIKIVHRSVQWNSADLEPFRFASDYEIKGLENQYRQYGLGVPLLAQQKPGTKKNITTKYTAQNICFPVTAILRFLPVAEKQETRSSAYDADAVIELYDPLTVPDVQFLRHNVPLESDLTTPLAFSLSDPRIAAASTIGLVRPDLLLKPVSEVLGKKPKKNELLSVNGTDFDRKTIKGLYMMQPHEPDKIPVIFVHGLWSSPVAWMEMFNALRSEPELRNRYEFYFYFYPTGQPFWVSAAQFRDDLEEFRQTFDPRRQDPVFDNIVLVGHSMGGLISMMQTIDSGNEFWNLVSDLPPQKLNASSKESGTLDIMTEVKKWFFFKRNPSIRQVITLATPYHGSKASNDLTQWLGRKLITLPENLQNITAALTNEEKLLKERSLVKIKTSVSSLDPELPVFDVIQKQRQTSTAVYYNIIGEIEQNTVMKKILPPSDGVVRTESAKLERCADEITVQCEHSSMPAHPKTILEVRRILMKRDF
ncbi:MAG: alpha/beta fold hydrolase [Planctomycetaceae bacterium]|nr:alpha/beta fold hydrolase [Planctomycetaceae bacterium]